MANKNKVIILILLICMALNIAACEDFFYQTKSETIFRGDLVLGQFDTIGRGSLGEWIIKEKDEKDFNEWAKSNEYYIATVAVRIAQGDSFDYLNGVEYHFYYKDRRWYYLGKFDKGYLFLDGVQVNILKNNEDTDENNSIVLSCPLFVDNKYVHQGEKIKCEYDWMAIVKMYKNFDIDQDKKQVYIADGSVDNNGDKYGYVITYYDDGHISFEVEI